MFVYNERHNPFYTLKAWPILRLEWMRDTVFMLKKINNNLNIVESYCLLLKINGSGDTEYVASLKEYELMKANKGCIIVFVISKTYHHLSVQYNVFHLFLINFKTKQTSTVNLQLIFFFREQYTRWFIFLHLYVLKCVRCVFFSGNFFIYHSKF